MSLDINVISSDELKRILRETTHLIASYITPTFGPYGQNTLVQSVDGVYSTKDGWNVAQRLKIINPESKTFPIAINAIKSLMLDVACSVALNGGDGTSTSMISADAMVRYLDNMLCEKEKKTNRPIDVKKLEVELRMTTKEIIEKLQEQAVTITDDNLAETIRQIALISTNWDEEIADVIRDIYVKTKNPIIKVENSETLETYAKYMEGYDLAGYLPSPGYSITNPEKGEFEATDPVILLFAPGVALHHSDLTGLIAMSRILEAEGKTLVTLASLYDENFLSGFNSENLKQIRAGFKPIKLVPFKYFAKTAIDKECINDFAVLINSMLLTDDNYQEYRESFLRAYSSVIEYGEACQDETKTNKDKDELAYKVQMTNEAALHDLYDIAGTCEKLIATENYIQGIGFSNVNQKAFDKRKKDLEYDIFVQRKDANAESNANDFIRMRRLRLGKLRCNMGVIKVGGFGKANLKSKRDAIEDATRACEVAYENGYLIDGGLAIPRAIQSILDELRNQETDGKRPYRNDVLRAFQMAFRSTTIMMYCNRYHDDDKSVITYREAMNHPGEAYNLLTETYDSTLITPVDVCKEVLNGCLRLVLVNATSNQFVYQDEDDLIRLIKAGSKTKEELDVEQAQKEIHGEDD